jgi:hypothetical protein
MGIESKHVLRAVESFIVNEYLRPSAVAGQAADGIEREQPL